MFLPSILLIAAVFGASDPHIVPVIEALQRRGTVLPSQTETFTSADGQQITTTISAWGYRTMACPSFPNGLNIIYAADLNIGVSTIMIGIETKNPSGGVWKATVSDVGYPDLDGNINEVRLEEGSPALSPATGQVFFDLAMTCFLMGL